MKKIIGLILLAALLVGAVVGLMTLMAPDTEEEQGPTFENEEANNWKSKIDALCSDGKWSEKEYSSIEDQIHSDRVMSQGALISIDEENALQKYLFAASCKYLNSQVDKLFKQSSYADAKIKTSEAMIQFLAPKLDSFGSNSNLTQASDMLSEYHRLLGAVSFSSGASYSQPLRAYNAPSAQSVQESIRRMKYYASHFSKNAQIREKVNNLAANRAKAENQYYDNLEKAIERHSNSTHDMTGLLDDEISFQQISTNSSAVNRLSSYVKNPDRWQ